MSDIRFGMPLTTLRSPKMGLGLVGILLASSLSSCVGGDNRLPTEFSARDALATNNFWDLRFDQSSDVGRFLFYNGQVYGVDSDFGYLGSLSFDQLTDEVSMSLTRYPVTGFYESKTLVTGDAAGRYEVDARLVVDSQVNGQIQGNYQLGSSTGTLLTINDGSWTQGSELRTLVGNWQDGGDLLTIESNTNSQVTYEAIDADGCTTLGRLELIDATQPALRAIVESRSSCIGLNSTTEFRGYAAVNISGQLEFFLDKGTHLLHMVYSR
jgi:hypothetical protein